LYQGRAYPGEAKMCLRLIAETDAHVPLAIAILLVSKDEAIAGYNYSQKTTVISYQRLPVSLKHDFID